MKQYYWYRAIELDKTGQIVEAIDEEIHCSPNHVNRVVWSRAQKYLLSDGIGTIRIDFIKQEKMPC